MAEPPTLPAGMTPVVPHLAVEGAAEALAFYAAAFGAEEIVRIPAPDGRLLNAAMRINGGAIMLNDRFEDCAGPSGGASAVTVHLFVADARAAEARALAAGATSVMKVERQFWGDDYGQVEDPFGIRWGLGSPGKEMSAAEIAEAARHV